MFTFRASAEVTEDRRTELTVPKEVPVGHAEFVVTLATHMDGSSKPARTSLADWADEQAENWGDRLDSTDVAGFTGRSF
jgi:hypothetical protein